MALLSLSTESLGLFIVFCAQSHALSTALTGFQYNYGFSHLILHWALSFLRAGAGADSSRLLSPTLCPCTRFPAEFGTQDGESLKERMHG